MDDETVLPARHRLDVDAYHRLGEADILENGARIELINGELIDMAPIGQGHAGTVNRLTETLVLACQGRAIVSVQNSLRLDRFSEPQPDFAVLRPRADYYGAGAFASAADTLLLIEVADRSLRYDRAVKLPLYARARIPECWIVDLKRRVVEVHREPSETGYNHVATKGVGDRLPLTMDPQIVIALDRVFG